MSDLHALLARIEAATGPDRKLDLDIARALVPDVIVLRQRRDPKTGGPGQRGDNEAFVYWEYTSSLDAAVALCERVLPGWDWSLETSETMVNGRVFHASDASLVGPDRNCSGQGNSPALALCAAVVKAKMEEQKP